MSGDGFMNWFEIVNKTTKYIEEHITEEITLEELASSNALSYSYFLKMFTMITGYTLNEYIRNRRLTLASYELLNTDNRILDIAVKYCYGSNEAFSRAFKQTHGINPSEARKSKIIHLQHFPYLKYDIPVKEISDLRYEVIDNLDVSFCGSTVHTVENLDDLLETRKILDGYMFDFIQKHNIKNITNYDPIVYKVKYNIDTIKKEYDVLFGFNQSDSEMCKSTQATIHIKHPRYLKYTAVGHNVESIRALKTIVFDEWYELNFEFDPVCEIEFATNRSDGRIDITYIVTVK